MPDGFSHVMICHLKNRPLFLDSAWSDLGSRNTLARSCYLLIYGRRPGWLRLCDRTFSLGHTTVTTICVASCWVETFILPWGALGWTAVNSFSTPNPMKGGTSDRVYAAFTADCWGSWTCTETASTVSGSIQQWRCLFCSYWLDVMGSCVYDILYGVLWGGWLFSSKFKIHIFESTARQTKHGVDAMPSIMSWSADDLIICTVNWSLIFLTVCWNFRSLYSQNNPAWSRFLLIYILQ